jgi:NADPH:quinone reductase-like Zn-dependent oxidoreductase
MKAMVYHQYGSPDVLRLEDIDTPEVKDKQVLVRVRAASANPIDFHFITGEPYLMRLQLGLRKPKSSRLGADVAGVVDAVGEDVTAFQPGDQVFGGTMGAFAEFVAVAEGSLAPKPANLSFEQAATVPAAALTALQALRDKGGIEPGHRVLINGASGGVGTFAVQIAKSFGAEVTGVCSTRNVDMVRSIGADYVFDYTQSDFTSGEPRYDLLLDLIGNRSLLACRRVMRPKGVYVASFGKPEQQWLGPLAHLLKMFVTSPFVSQKMRTFVTKVTTEDLLLLKEMLEAGKVTPVIDRTYPLPELHEAIRYVQEGHTQGKVVITI